MGRGGRTIIRAFHHDRGMAGVYYVNVVNKRDDRIPFQYVAVSSGNLRDKVRVRETSEI